MQKKLLAAAVSSLIAGQAMAVTVYDDGSNKFDVGGHIGVRVVNQKNGNDTSNTNTKGDESRFNLVAESNLNESTTAFATGEWGFDVTSEDADNDNDDNTFSTRLGFVGISNDRLGTLSIGKQWSAYNRVGGWTDQFATVGGEASGLYAHNEAALGVGRADDALQYHWGANSLNVYAQYQFADNEKISHDPFDIILGSPISRQRKESYGLAVSYDLPMGISFGAAYNEARFEEEDQDKAQATLIGIKYIQGAIYAAVTYSQMKNHASFLQRKTEGVVKDFYSVFEKAVGTEVYVSYELNDNFKLETGYNELKNDGDAVSDAEKATKVKYFPVGLVYTSGALQLSATYKYNKGTWLVLEDSAVGVVQKDVEDEFVVQARYHF